MPARSWEFPQAGYRRNRTHAKGKLEHSIGAGKPGLSELSPWGKRALRAGIAVLPNATVSGPRGARERFERMGKKDQVKRAGGRGLRAKPEWPAPRLSLAAAGLEEVFDQKIAHVCDLLSGYRVIEECATL